MPGVVQSQLCSQPGAMALLRSRLPSLVQSPPKVIGVTTAGLKLTIPTLGPKSAEQLEGHSMPAGVLSTTIGVIVPHE